jgi:hypothetical protein
MKNADFALELEQKPVHSLQVGKVVLQIPSDAPGEGSSANEACLLGFIATLIIQADVPT